jgi:hypothetical protein
MLMGSFSELRHYTAWAPAGATLPSEKQAIAALLIADISNRAGAWFALETLHLPAF